MLHNLDNPPGRRTGVHAPLRTAWGALLLTKKKRKIEEGDPRPWGTLGGSALQDEWTRVAWRREVRTRTGLDLYPESQFVVVDHVPRGRYAEGTNYVYDAKGDSGILAPDTTITLHPELAEYRFVPGDELDDYLDEHQARRARAILAALEDGQVRELEFGYPAGSLSDKVTG